MNSSSHSLLLVLLLSMLCIGCGGNNGDTVTTDKSDFEAPIDDPLVIGTGTSDDLFNQDNIIDIDIQMATEDFSILRAEGRSLASAGSECIADFEFTHFVAEVTIDGVTVSDVDIRKKGFLGSISRIRPSLKLNFDTLVEGRRYNGMERMSLNNNRQDPSFSHQCMAFDLFEKAGLVAPRCNFARVTVNGEELGIYSHVESIKKPFLERNYDDKTGNLYEGQIADFGVNINDKFEKKTNKDENDRSDLAAVAEALSLDDANLIATLPQLIDVDEFIRFWAVETLIGHWDSATGNANNYYIYNNPDDGLFHYIPWGTDAAFTGVNILKPKTGYLYRNNHIASRLYAIEQFKTQYHNTLIELLDSIWNEEALLAELDRIQLLTGTPESDYSSTEAFIAGIGAEGDPKYVRSQRQRITSAIAGLEPEQTEFLIDDEVVDCSSPAATTTLSVDMQSSGNSDETSGTDTGSFTFINREGRSITADLTFASGYVDSVEYAMNDDTSPPVVSLLLIGLDLADSFKPYVLQIYIEAPDYVPGDHSLQGFATALMLLAVDDSGPSTKVDLIALGDTGTITIGDIGGSGSEGDVELTITAEMGFSQTQTGSLAP